MRILSVAAVSVLVLIPSATAGGFAPIGDMALERASFTATRLVNGSVLVASGGRGELYRPDSKDFVLTGAMTSSRGGHTATLLPSGKVVLIGGESAVATAELYDTVTGTFTATASMAVPRASHTATLLPTGEVLVIGGWRFNAPNSALASAELYDPATETFTSTGSMATARVRHTATLLPDGRVLVVGGYDSSFTALASAEFWDPATGQFSATGRPLSAARADHTATLVRNGKVLVAGGFTAFPGPAVATAEIFDPGSGDFAPTGPMTTPRGDHTASLLNDGRVLIAGGFTAFPFLGATLSSAEIYAPQTGMFSATSHLFQGRGRHAATLLADGDVLVAGGMAQCCSLLRSAEVFDGPEGGDTTPPVLNVPDVATDATSPAGAIVTYEATATDDVDGPVPVTCAPPSGSLLPIGDTIVDCEASDSAGNTAEASFNVHVKGAVEQLSDLMAVVATTPAGGLNFMLNRALEAVNTGQISRACSELATFVRTVYDLARPPRPKLTAAQAKAFTDAARRIRAVIGC